MGRQLRLIMQHRGVTVEEIADATGISSECLEAYCRSEKEPTTAHLLALCDTLKVHADVLLGNVLYCPPRFKQEDVHNDPFSQAWDLLEQYRLLDGRQRNEICQFMDSLSDRR